MTEATDPEERSGELDDRDVEKIDEGQLTQQIESNENSMEDH